jgi:PhnO protein
MVRRSTIQDLEAVYQLICELENDELSHTEFTRIYCDQMPDDRYCCLVYETDGEIAGFLNLRFEEQLHHCSKIAEILEFSVLASARSRGIGKELLESASTVAKEHGCEQIEAASGRQRSDAHRFYQREGMQNSHIKLTKKLPG